MGALPPTRGPLGRSMLPSFSFLQKGTRDEKRTIPLTLEAIDRNRNVSRALRPVVHHGPTKKRAVEEEAQKMGVRQWQAKQEEELLSYMKKKGF